MLPKLIIIPDYRLKGMPPRNPILELPLAVYHSFINIKINSFPVCIAGQIATKFLPSQVMNIATFAKGKMAT